MSREKELTAVEWLLEQLDVETVLTRRQLSDVINQAKEMEKEQQNINEEKLRESLLTISLINPVHLKMVSDGRGEFPDSYNLTQKGIDDLVETIKSR
jgi:hypothetical protein